MKNWRTPVLAVAAAVIAAGLLADPSPRPYRAGAASPAPAAATAAPAGATSDVWFCAGGSANDGGLADHRIAIINTGDQARAATITGMTSREAARPPVTKAFPVGPYGRVDVRLADVVGQAAYAGATVEIDGGGVLVEHSVVHPQIGADRAPCATSTAEHWYLPISITGTEKNAQARALVAIYNPYFDDAVVDVAFSGDAANPPPELAAVVVGARSVSVIDLNSAAPVSDQVAVSVTARTGRVAVDRIEIFDDPRARRDLVLTPGVAAAARTWVYPSGRLGPNRSERLVLYNTSADHVTATIEVRPDDRALAVEPFEIAVAPRRHAVLDLSAEARLTDAKVTGYALIVRAPSDVLVTERLITVTPGQPGAGVASSTGSAIAARVFYVDGGAAAPTDASEFVVFNPNRRSIAQVSIDVIADGKRQPGGAAAKFDLQPGERRAVPFAALGGGQFVVAIASSAPVMVERETVGANVRSAAMGVPGRRDVEAVDVIQLELGP